MKIHCEFAMGISIFKLYRFLMVNFSSITFATSMMESRKTNTIFTMLVERYLEQIETRPFSAPDFLLKITYL